MELILIGGVIGFIASWAVFRHENWRLEDKLEEQRERADDLTRELIVAYQRMGMDYQKRDAEQCSDKRSDYFKTW